MNAASERNTTPNNQRGQSIVEIALLTPLLLIALYIPADFGVSFFMGNLVQTAAREGARIGSGLQKSGSVPNLLFSSAEAATVKTEVINRLPAYLTNKTVTVTFYTGTACMEFVQVTAPAQRLSSSMMFAPRPVNVVMSPDSSSESHTLRRNVPLKAGSL
jgi:Flp pilus assembly protein TadG